MPPKKSKGSSARDAAKALIAEHHEAVSAKKALCADAVEFLKEVFAANAALSPRDRISATAAMEKLAELRLWTGARQKFDRAIREQFGRGWSR